MKKIYCYDAYESWSPALQAACERKGWEFETLAFGKPVPRDGWVFIRLTMEPIRLRLEKQWVTEQCSDHPYLITDIRQLLNYEDKVAQVDLLREFLPTTSVYYSLDEIDWRGGYPCISKAAVGASSQFVRLIPNRLELIREAKAIFGGGLPLNTKKWKCQEGYQYVQEFLPKNDYTTRINIVGDQVAVWRRFNYADKPLAETGNAVPLAPEDAEEEIEFARFVASAIGTKWCALDILRDHEKDQLVCLETSLGWPWPGVGGGVWTNGEPWENMFDVLLDEIEAGAFPA